MQTSYSLYSMPTVSELNILFGVYVGGMQDESCAGIGRDQLCDYVIIERGVQNVENGASEKKLSA